MNSPSQTTPVSSRYRWIICGLLFFATTFNYMDRQVISYLKDYFCRPAHQAGDVQTFSKGDFMDLPSLAVKLKQPTNAISTYVSANLSPATLAFLADYSGSGPISESLQTNLVPNLAQSLNAMVTNQPLYDAGRFAGVTLHADTQKLLAFEPAGRRIAALEPPAAGRCLSARNIAGRLRLVEHGLCKSDLVFHCVLCGHDHHRRLDH